MGIQKKTDFAILNILRVGLYCLNNPQKNI